MIFLDTNIISYYFKDNSKVVEELVAAIRNRQKVCITAINIYEVIKGFNWKNNKKKEALFRKFLPNLSVFTIDEQVVEIAAKIYASLRKKGVTIGDADILIAAIVIKNNGTLVTNNTKHFRIIDQLKVQNWI